MKPTQTLRIPNPSKALVDFIENAQERKKERMQAMREKFLKTHGV